MSNTSAPDSGYTPTNLPQDGTTNYIDAADVTTDIQGLTDRFNAHLHTFTDPDVVTTAWTAYTPTFTGFSANPASYVCRYTTIGKVVHLVYDGGYSAGTSNATTFTMTLPVAAVKPVSVVARVYDNGAWTTGLVRIIGATGDTKITLYKTTAEGAFTASGAKDAQFEIFYEIA